MPLPRPYRPRPWTPLTDAEWSTLKPYIENPGPGRPLADPRGRLDAIFAICLTNTPWSLISTDHGPTATIHRCFRRWAHAGLWSRLLTQSARRRAPRPLRALKPWLAAVFRRCHRILGLAAVILARRLHVHRALPGPSWFFPDPDLSARVHAWLAAKLRNPDDPALATILKVAKAALRHLDRRRPVPRAFVPLG